MSTDAAPPNLPTETKVRRPISEILARGADADPPLPVDQSAAALEQRLQKETDGRNEDRFYAFGFGTILLDAAIFPHMPTVGIVCIFILEIVMLIGLAKRLGNEHVTILLDRLFHQLLKWVGPKSDA
jgi:hypothetical protein